MIEPKEYKVNPTITERMLLLNKFDNILDYYSYKKPLYGNYIFLKLLIDKEDNYLIINVHDNNGYTYSPFYNPNDRHNNTVYDEVTKNYNKFMDGLVKKKILEYKEEEDDVMRQDSKIIKIKYFTNIDKIKSISKGDLIDLRAAQDIEMKKGEFKLIPLGVAMQIPEGYKANVYPRSSTYKNFGIILANSVGQIDESYCGDQDEWMFPAIALRDTVIHKNDRICQFEIQKKQPKIVFEEVDKLWNKNRGGIGSTGKL